MIQEKNKLNCRIPFQYGKIVLLANIRKNKIIPKLYIKNNIKRIFSDPYKPPNNEVVEVVHKNYDHTTTGYKPIDLFSNTTIMFLMQ